MGGTMPNEIFRNRIINTIKHAYEQYKESSIPDAHMPTIGKIREIAAKGIIEPILPEDFKIKISGFVIDHIGNKSKETDLLIYSKKILPPVMYESEEIYFPAESVLFAIEIKSTLTAGEVKDAYDKAVYLSETIKYSSGRYDENLNPIPHEVNTIISVLFGFSSDLTGTGKTELDRYLEIERETGKIGLKGICVIGKGNWRHSRIQHGWVFKPHTENYDEVIDFISVIINTLHEIKESRGFPRLGPYLMSPIE